MLIGESLIRAQDIRVKIRELLGDEPRRGGAINRILAWSMTVGLLTLAGCVNQEIHEYSPKWDSWMAAARDDRIKEMGIPTRCHSFKEGGEVCEGWSHCRTGVRI